MPGNLIMTTILEPTIERAPAPESSDPGFGLVFAASAVLAIVGSFARNSLTHSTAFGSRWGACCTDIVLRA
jgi:hypothetical protein